jgi:hypothetical protein
VLPLVFVEPLHLDVEERLRIDLDAGAIFDEAGQRPLVLGFGLPPLPPEGGVGAQRFNLLKPFL